MSKSLKFLLLFFLLLIFSTYVPKNQTDIKSIILPIKNIQVRNVKVIDEVLLIEKLSYLIGKNILFIDKDKVRSTIMKFDFVSSFQLKKIYPQTLEVIIDEKKPVAIYMDGKKKLFISDKGKMINYIEVKEFTNLPIIFGKKIKFKNFFNDLKKINFPINEIKTLHYLDIGRWDIVFKNGITVKLPKENYRDILQKFLLVYNDSDFEKYKIFDYRIKNQLILN
tara:strand:+ start:548 stop:1216 length:669 start_codon:yes stop_codon:yes gene_type:complete